LCKRNKTHDKMKIAVLAWGSLIWDKRELAIVGDWQTNGPVLPIEFSRVSRDGRLTLVIDPQNGVAVTTRFAHSKLTNLNEAIANLRSREGNPPIDRIGYVNLASNTEREWSRQKHPGACDKIKAWAQTSDWQAVVWTALLSNFKSNGRPPFSVCAAVHYVTNLGEPDKTKAIEYVRRAPPEVDTPVRRALAAANAV
jgi:hypothetical protein